MLRIGVWCTQHCVRSHLESHTSTLIEVFGFKMYSYCCLNLLFDVMYWLNNCIVYKTWTSLSVVVVVVVLFFYVRRPQCKLDLYICTILLMMSSCVNFVKLSYYLILSYLSYIGILNLSGYNAICSWYKLRHTCYRGNICSLWCCKPDMML